MAMVDMLDNCMWECVQVYEEAAESAREVHAMVDLLLLAVCELLVPKLEWLVEHLKELVEELGLIGGPRLLDLNLSFNYITFSYTASHWTTTHHIELHYITKSQVTLHCVIGHLGTLSYIKI